MRCERRRQIEQLSLPVLVAPHGSLLPPPVSLRQHPAWGAFSSCAVLVQAVWLLGAVRSLLAPFEDRPRGSKSSLLSFHVEFGALDLSAVAVLSSSVCGCGSDSVFLSVFGFASLSPPLQQR